MWPCLPGELFVASFWVLNNYLFLHLSSCQRKARGYFKDVLFLSSFRMRVNFALYLKSVKVTVSLGKTIESCKEMLKIKLSNYKVVVGFHSHVSSCPYFALVNR